ncbi:DotI/IcmL/TraM family protein [Morganella psychrotolerans]|uniref:DotI/IcmL/TraM family protein n=1 Tax=Morganella psychrotolerans TaxID=368603 RepID=UPI0039AF5806
MAELSVNQTETDISKKKDSEERAFQHGLALQRRQELGAAFAHRCLIIAVWLSVFLAVSCALNIYLIHAVINTPVKYFATENGRVTPMIPLDQPGFGAGQVAGFGADTLRESFTLDFVNYKQQMTSVNPKYSEIGFQDYYKALATSNVLDAVKSKRMNLSVDVGPGVIRSKGLLGNVYVWEYQYPVSLKLNGQQTSTPQQRFIFTIRIERTDVREKPEGLHVTQIITSNAG